MKCSLLLIILLTSIPITIHGKESFLKCLQFKFKSLLKELKTKKNYHFHSNISNPHKQRKKLMNSFKSIDKIIFGYLEIPSSQNFDIIPQSKSAHFIKKSNTLKLPLEITVGKGRLGRYQL